MNTREREPKQRAQNIISILIEPQVGAPDLQVPVVTDREKMLSIDGIDYSFTLHSSGRLSTRRKRSCGRQY